VNGNVSEHYTGNATDIFTINGKPAVGERLIRAGRAALIAAGMPRKCAQGAGGLYNVGNHQIIFGTNRACRTAATTWTTCTSARTRTSQDGPPAARGCAISRGAGAGRGCGLYAAGKVKAEGESWLASVASIEDYAKAGKGPFRGWTTDGSKAKKGDLVVLFGRGQHVGTVRSIDSNYAYTWEGNTSARARAARRATAAAPTSVLARARARPTATRS
jgi:hypothetical protein